MAITRWRCDCMALVEGLKCLGCGSTREYYGSTQGASPQVRDRVRRRPEFIHPATEDEDRRRTTPEYGQVRSAVLEWGPDGVVSAYERMVERTR